MRVSTAGSMKFSFGGYAYSEPSTRNSRKGGAVGLFWFSARPNWRCRREAYLRAIGRRDELISEGYDARRHHRNGPFFPVGDMRVTMIDRARSGFASRTERSRD